MKGCQVVGVAGGAEKCHHAKEVLGFDECIDHKADDFAMQLAKACLQSGQIKYKEQIISPLPSNHSQLKYTKK